MTWITLLFVSAWLPLVRSIMDGPSYQWGYGIFGLQWGGSGLRGDFWFAALRAAIAIAFLFFGWRKPNGAVRVAMVLMAGLMLASTIFSVLNAPETFRFYGDTLGIDVSLTIVAPVLDGAMLLLTLLFWRKARQIEVPPFGSTSRALLGLFLLLLPVQYLLLSSSQGQGARDVLGVLLTIAGWLMLSLGLAHWGTSVRDSQRREMATA